MNSIKLQIATLEDIPTIYLLAEKIWNIHYVPIIGQEQVDFMLSTMYSQEALTEQMTVKNHTFYLIISAEKTIGYLSVSGMEDMFIHKFYIDPNEQSKGIGSAVFKNLVALYPSLKTFRLTVNRKNYKSINFYFKNNFVIEKVEDFDIGHGYYMNDFIMLWNHKG